MEYTISKEIAHTIAVGLYQRMGEYVAAAKQNNPVEYERFKAEYLAKLSVPVKRRRTHKGRTASR